MKNLTTSIYSKTTGSALASRVDSRIYKGRADQGSDYPYVVFNVISDVPDDTFTEELEDVLDQFSLFSATYGTTEVENMYTDLKTLYDKCTLSITGSTLLHMLRQNAVLMPEDHTAPSGVTTGGTIPVWHYAVTYEIKTKVG